MAQINLFDYLFEQIETKIPETYEIELDFDAKKHQIMIVLRLFAENNQQVAIEDVDGNLALDVITFEDAIVLNAGKAKISEDEYLAVLPFDRKQGLTKKQIEQLVEQILMTLDNGQSDLLDFINDDLEVFELHFENPWTEDATGERLAYPKF